MRRRGSNASQAAPGQGFSPAAPPAENLVASPRIWYSKYVPSGKATFLILALVRCYSARVNIIHDCDEVFNYWEPLHFLLYGYGLQTWEYGSQFALRTYMYLLLHVPVAGPAAMYLGSSGGKAAVFFGVRAFLGLCSSVCEALVYRALLSRCGEGIASYALLFMVFSSGLFTSATSMLPSVFTMGSMMVALAGVIQGRPKVVVWATAGGAVLGWPFALAAAVPYALYVLAAGRFWGAVFTGAFTVALTLGASAGADWVFYGRWTISQLNILTYNAGGGDSHLYGTEPWHFYLRNGVNNWNALLPLALAMPLVLAAAHIIAPASRPGGAARARLLAAVTPLHLWMATISSLPHKEERFMYVVYPHICVGAAATMSSLPVVLSPVLRKLTVPRRLSFRLVRWGCMLVALLACVLCAARSAALIGNYDAPMRIYRHLPPTNETTTVCVGSEWHRFPSSFFLPGPKYRLGFIKSDFSGHLPLPFDSAKGGTAGAPKALNDRNREVPEQYLKGGERKCDYFVDLELAGGEKEWRSKKAGTWKTVASYPFVDAPRSPALFRALYVPGLSPQRLAYGRYVLLKRRSWL